MTASRDRDLAPLGQQAQPGPPEPATSGEAALAQQPRPTVVALPDEIDASNDGQVLDNLIRALDDRAAVLIADAGGTTFCASAGISALLVAHHRAVAAGKQLRVAASPAVRRILELTGADYVLDTYPTLGAALAGRARPPA